MNMAPQFEKLVGPVGRGNRIRRVGFRGIRLLPTAVPLDLLHCPDKHNLLFPIPGGYFILAREASLPEFPCDRVAVPKDTPWIARLMATELFDDPLQGWVFPDVGTRKQQSERLARFLIEPLVSSGNVMVIEDPSQQIASAAVWIPPYPPALSRWGHYRESLFMRWMFGQRIYQIRRGWSLLAARHPPQPYWYLLALVTASNRRGQGYARLLLNRQFSKCDANKETIALEAAQPANLTYYQRFGFQLRGEVIPENGPRVWLMTRESGVLGNL